MSDLEREIDRDIYELAEAELKANLAFSQIESKYRVKHMIMESSGQFTNEELLAMEEADKEAESGDKRSVIRKLIDKIIEKIRSFINKFKRIKEDHEIGPDDDVNMPVSEDDIRAYIKSADTITEKLDKVLQAAKGDSKKAYDDALKEYEQATQNADWLDSISDEVLNAEKNAKAGKKIGHYIIKGSIVMAAIAAARKILETGEKVAVLTGEAIASGAGKAAGALFGHFKESDVNVENEAKNLSSKVNALTGKTGRLESFFNRVLNRKSKNIGEDQKKKDYDANKAALDEEGENRTGNVDYKKTAFNKKKDVDLFPWLNQYFNGNLKDLGGFDTPRPNYVNEDRMRKYLVDTNGDIFERISKWAQEDAHSEEYSGDVYLELADRKINVYSNIAKELKKGTNYFTSRYEFKKDSDGHDTIFTKTDVDLDYRDGVIGRRKTVHVSSGKDIRKALWGDNVYTAHPELDIDDDNFGAGWGNKLHNASNSSGSSSGSSSSSGNGGSGSSGGSSGNSSSSSGGNGGSGGSSGSTGGGSSSGNGGSGSSGGSSGNSSSLSSLPKKWAKRLEASTDGGSPIFFDFWGVFFRKGKIEEYKKRQHELFDAYNKYRNDNGMKPITWGESQARKALEAMSSNKSVDDNGNAWMYDEDKGKNQNNNNNKKSGKKGSVNYSKNDFITRFYQTKSTKDLNSAIDQYIKGAKDNPNIQDVDDNKIHGIPVKYIRANFGKELGNGKDRKSEFFNEFKSKIDNNKSLNGSKEVGNLVDTVKKNGLVWLQRNLNEYKESHNASVRTAYNTLIQTMKHYGWHESYAL
nr:MAG TPA: neurotoxin [Caudoviricetes sp.]